MMEPVTDAELSEFRKGVDHVGPRPWKKLQEFMMQYPDSALIPDAKETLIWSRRRKSSPNMEREELSVCREECNDDEK